MAIGVGAKPSFQYAQHCDLDHLHCQFRYRVDPRATEARILQKKLVVSHIPHHPALRVFRIFRFVRFLRAARVARGIQLVRVVGSLNRGMRALGASMNRRGFGYIVALTCVVTLSGAAGMYAFENDSPGGLTSYGEALWWTAMLMTTMGSGYWPHSPEGRVLCIILALYAFGIFGYVTATLATYFVGRDAAHVDGEVAGTVAIGELKNEIAELRAEIGQLMRRDGP
jgi:voltage-gated potassium channel